MNYLLKEFSFNNRLYDICNTYITSLNNENEDDEKDEKEEEKLNLLKNIIYKIFINGVYHWDDVYSLLYYIDSLKDIKFKKDTDIKIRSNLTSLIKTEENKVFNLYIICNEKGNDVIKQFDYVKKIEILYEKDKEIEKNRFFDNIKVKENVIEKLKAMKKSIQENIALRSIFLEKIGLCLDNCQGRFS